MKQRLAYCLLRACAVAPYAGAWIETLIAFGVPVTDESLPTRERGLKLMHLTIPIYVIICRSLRGSVD